MRRVFVPLLVAMVFVCGCQTGQKNAIATTSGENFKTYKLRGKVVRTDSTKGEVTVDHEAIPGFMDAMTMPYQLKDANIASELHPGDVITADLLVPQESQADFL